MNEVDRDADVCYLNGLICIQTSRLAGEMILLQLSIRVEVPCTLLEVVSRMASLGFEKSYRETVILMTRSYLSKLSSIRSAENSTLPPEATTEQVEALPAGFLLISSDLTEINLRADYRHRLLSLCSDVGLAAESKSGRSVADFLGALLPDVAEICYKIGLVNVRTSSTAQNVEYFIGFKRKDINRAVVPSQLAISRAVVLVLRSWSLFLLPLAVYQVWNMDMQSSSSKNQARICGSTPTTRSHENVETTAPLSGQLPPPAATNHPLGSR